MDDLLLFTPSKESHMSNLKDLLKALLKNGLKISPKKCSNQPTIHGKRDIHSKQKNVCGTFEKQIGGDSKITTPQNSERMQTFCRYGEFSEYVLPRTTEIVETYI